MSVQEDEKLIEEDQTLLTENETHDIEEAEKQLTQEECPCAYSLSFKVIPDDSESSNENVKNVATNSDEDDFVKIENNPESEESESSEEEELSSSSEESDSSEEKSSEACKTWIPLLIATFLAFGVLVSLITFFPPSQNAETEWMRYANNCCNIHFGQMRCLLDLPCRHKLSRWIDMNSKFSNETNHLNRCCYLYAPYDTSYFFSQYYCDPHCLKPRLI